MPDLNEAKTRALLINPQLERAGWNLSDHSQVQFEVPVKGYDPTPWNGFTDFCLYDVDGSVLAVIEAKKTARNARDGEEQLRQYVTEISAKQDFSPFGFMTNGLHHFFWEVDLTHPRSIAGFFSADDLRRLRFIRQHKTPLKDTPINKKIVERAYQHEAIRRVAETFESGRRRALLVMATGTGKTRTTMGLIDVFLQSSYAQKVLFLADRDALVEQALNDGFKSFLPNEPRVRIRTATIDPNKRLYVATQQTMGVCYDRFSPAFFDLIVFDEAHRSIFNRFTEVIEYFDARMSGINSSERRRSSKRPSPASTTVRRIWLSSLCPEAIRFEAPSCVRLHGKGRKERICPLWPETVLLLKKLLERQPRAPNERMFVNRYGEPLGASGVRFKLAAYLEAAAKTVPTLRSKRVTPHSFRHATAVHLVSAGVDITVIRSWLGHVSLDTTNHYAQANLETKRKALERVAAPAPSGRLPSWKRDASVLAWLDTL